MISIKTFQDFEKVKNSEKTLKDFLLNAIGEHQASEKYTMALTAERYYKQDTDINRYQKFVYNVLGQKRPDLWSANNKLPSNWHFYFATQEIEFLLGKGISFKKSDTKSKLGKDFDLQVKRILLNAINGSCGYGVWDVNHIVPLKYTEFVPLLDERTAVIMAGIRFWQIDDDKPLNVILYELDGYTEYSKGKNDIELVTTQEKRAYKEIISKSVVDGEQIEGYENYPGFPVVPMRFINDESDFAGKKSTIDAYDLIVSGLANNVSKSDFVYWVIKNAGGFENDGEALQTFIENLHTVHAIELDENSDATPHTVEAPYQASTETAEKLREKLYNDYMGVDVKNIAAGNVTATQIRAAYENLRMKCDLIKDYVTEFINNILALAGIDDEPSYTPTMIANINESVQTLLLADPYLDDETMIRKLCDYFGFADMADEIIKRRDAEELDRFNGQKPEPPNNEKNEEGEEE